MNPGEYSALDAVALAARIRDGEVTAAQVSRAAREAIMQVNGSLNALAAPLLEEPLRYDETGGLAGVPFLVKDEGPHAAGLAWSSGSVYYDGSIAEADSIGIRRARGAGLAILGTTATPEMCMNFATETRLRGITQNPWDLSRTPGGSSGGAAAFVAAGAVPIAHATDGLGSIRIPAAFTGLVGLKPSRGRTPCGVDGYSGAGYDFVVTRTVRDTAAALDVYAGPALESKYRVPRPARPYASLIGQAPRPLSIGYTTSPWGGVPVSSSSVRAVEEVAEALAAEGHAVREVALEPDVDRVVSAFRAISARSFLTQFPPSSRHPTPETVEGVSWAIWNDARAMTAAEMAAGLADFDQVVRDLAAWFATVDVLVTPTSPVPAFLHGALDYDDANHTIDSWIREMLTVGAYTAPFNIGGQPAVSVPGRPDAAGLPVGVQLVAATGDDALVLQLAATIERALPWSGRRPGVYVK